MFLLPSSPLVCWAFPLVLNHESGRSGLDRCPRLLRGNFERSAFYYHPLFVRSTNRDCRRRVGEMKRPKKLALVVELSVRSPAIDGGC